MCLPLRLVLTHLDGSRPDVGANRLLSRCRRCRRPGAAHRHPLRWSDNPGRDPADDGVFDRTKLPSNTCVPVRGASLKPRPGPLVCESRPRNRRQAGVSIGHWSAQHASAQLVVRRPSPRSRSSHRPVAIRRRGAGNHHRHLSDPGWPGWPSVEYNINIRIPPTPPSRGVPPKFASPAWPVLRNRY